MEHDRAGQLLDRIGVLGQPADLDLLIFFARHPRVLIATDRLAALTGYEPEQTAGSLDVLLNAGLITLAQKPSGAPRLYVFVPAAGAEWIHELFTIATTPPGRVALRRALAARSKPAAATRPKPAGRDREAARRRPFLVRKPAARGGRSQQGEDA